MTIISFHSAQCLIILSNKVRKFPNTLLEINHIKEECSLVVLFGLKATNTLP